MYRHVITKIISPLVVVLAFFLLTQTATAATYTVNVSDNSLNGHANADPDEDSIDCVAIGEIGTNDCSLRRAIDEAIASAENVTINLPADTITLAQTNAAGNEDANDTGDLDYSNANTITLTIQGNSAATSIIDANGDTLSDRALELNGAGLTVNMNDVTITGGSLLAGGGAVEVNHAGAIITFNDCIISNNIVTGSHGGGLSLAGNITINRCTIRDNQVTGLSGNGGGIYQNATATLTINNSTISGNSVNSAAAVDGGGIVIASTATLTVTNSTISGNSAAGGEGGGVYLATGSFGTFTHSTIAGNTANNGGGVYHNSTGTVTLEHSLLADNTGTTTGPNCAGNSIVSNDYNLIESTSGCTLSGTTTNNVTGSDPGLAALADNGSVNKTHKITSTSVAYNIIPSATCDSALTTMEDQRGLTRPGGSNCDIGAYEVDQTNPTVTVTTGDDSVECGVDTWVNAGATVSDNFSIGLTASASGSVTEETIGSYTITYTSTADNDGNTNTNTRTVTVQDVTAPTITLNGNATMTHEAGTAYTDAGASASDACDASSTLSTSNGVNSSTLGAQTVSYLALDSTGNSRTSTRTVTVQDTIAPTITRLGNAEVTVTEGDTYTDAGATASDSFAGNLTANITTSNPVDTATPNTYTVTYTVADPSGNAATAVTRAVTVQAGSNSDDPDEPTDPDDPSEPDDPTDPDDPSDPDDPTDPDEPDNPDEEIEDIVSVSTNGKFLRVFVNDVQVAQKKVGKKKLNKKFYKLKTKKLYKAKPYTTVAYLAALQNKAKLIVFQLTSDYALKKKVSKTFSTLQRKQVSLKFNVKKKRIKAAIGSKAKKVQRTWKLKENGKLKRI